MCLLCNHFPSLRLRFLCHCPPYFGFHFSSSILLCLLVDPRLRARYYYFWFGDLSRLHLGGTSLDGIFCFPLLFKLPPQYLTVFGLFIWVWRVGLIDNDSASLSQVSYEGVPMEWTLHFGFCRTVGRRGINIVVCSRLHRW